MGDKEKSSKGSKGVPEPPKKKKSGFLKNLFLLALLVVVVMGGVSYFTFEPQDLSDIDGYEEQIQRPAREPRDLLAVLESARENGLSVKISEEELNAYLKYTLKFEQEGLFKNYMEAKGVWVRLGDGEAEVIIERELNGQRRHTISMYLKAEQREEGGNLHTVVHRTTGRFGRVHIGFLRGLMLLVKSSFIELGAQYSEELELVKMMLKSRVKITIREGELELSAPESR